MDSEEGSSELGGVLLSLSGGKVWRIRVPDGTVVSFACGGFD